jgi:hypothetical protein
MVRVGSQNALVGGAVDITILSQQVINQGSGGNPLRSYGFWYNFMTRENAPGMDEPGFMVFVGDKMVHQVWPTDIPSFDGDASTVDATGWRYLSIDLSQYNNPVVSIAFYAGNTVDLVRNSFVYIDDVSTNEAAASPAGQFSIHATDDVGVASVHYSYSLDGLPGDEVTGSGPNDMTFTIPSQPNDGTPAGDGRVTYWAVDTAGNIEVPKTTHVSIDGTAPDPVTDLTVTDDGLGDFTLNWTAPGDMNPYGINQVAEYEVRYSTSALDPTMSDATWDALPTPTLYNLTGLPGGGLRAPRIAGAPEVIRAHVNNGPNTYYFGSRIARD